MEQAHEYNWQLATSPEFIEKKDVNWLPNEKYHVRPCLKSQRHLCHKTKFDIVEFENSILVPIASLSVHIRYSSMIDALQQIVYICTQYLTDI